MEIVGPTLSHGLSAAAELGKKDCPTRWAWDNTCATGSPHLAWSASFTGTALIGAQGRPWLRPVVDCG